MRFVLFATIPVGAVAAGVPASLTGSRDAVLVMLAGNVLSSVLLCASPLRTMRDLPAGPAGLIGSSPTAAHT